MPARKRNRHLLILGKSGSGKTFLIKEAIRRGKFGPRVLILDADGEYGEIKGVEEISLDDAIEKAPNLNYFTYSIVIDDEETMQQDAEYLARLAQAMGDCTIVFEEISDYTNNPKIRTLFRRGRKLDVRCVAISQRPAEIHKTVTSQAACVIAFRFDEPRDLEYIKLRFGRDAAQRVQNLDAEKFEIAVWGDESVYNETFENAQYQKSKPEKSDRPMP